MRDRGAAGSAAPARGEARPSSGGRLLPGLPPDGTVGRIVRKEMKKKVFTEQDEELSGLNVDVLRGNRN